MSEKSNRIYLLEEAGVASALLKLGIPTMVGMLISALYNAIDAYFVGGLGMSSMGAVSVVFPIVQIIIGLGMMFGAGASSYISRLLGKGDIVQAGKTASTSVFSGLLVSAAIIGVILIFLDPVLTALGATETILPYARAYAKIYVTGSILNVFSVMMNQMITAQGDAKYTMLAMLTGSIANVILDPVMIYGMDMGIEGAAAATVISLFINMAFYIVYIAGKKGVLKFSFRNIEPSKSIYGEVLKIGVPVLMFQLLASASMGLTNSAAKPYGDYAVAAMGAVIRVMTVVTYVVFGFLKGFQPFAGYNYGAGKFDRLKKSVKLCMIWTTVFCAAAAIVLTAAAAPIVSVFGTDADMADMAAKALALNAVTFVTFGFHMVYASLYLAIGKSRAGGLLSLSRQGIFFFPLIFLLPRFFDINGLIWVQPAADILTAVLTVIFAVKINRSLSSELKERSN